MQYEWLEGPGLRQTNSREAVCLTALCFTNHQQENLYLLKLYCSCNNIGPMFPAKYIHRYRQRTQKMMHVLTSVHKVSGGTIGSLHSSMYVRVFNPHALSSSNPSLASTYRRHEKEKRRAYQQRILEVEHGSFTPLVYSAAGGMGPAAPVTYRGIASLLAEERTAILQDHWLASVCPQLLSDQISHSVHPWSTLCQTQAMQTIHGLLNRTCG